MVLPDDSKLSPHDRNLPLTLTWAEEGNEWRRNGGRGLEPVGGDGDEQPPELPPNGGRATASASEGSGSSKEAEDREDMREARDRANEMALQLMLEEETPASSMIESKSRRKKKKKKGKGATQPGGPDDASDCEEDCINPFAIEECVSSSAVSSGAVRLPETKELCTTSPSYRAVLRKAGQRQSKTLQTQVAQVKRNLEVQEMTLKVQMELAEEHLRQSDLLRRLEDEMETLVVGNEDVLDDSCVAERVASALAQKNDLVSAAVSWQQSLRRKTLHSRQQLLGRSVLAEDASKSAQLHKAVEERDAALQVRDTAVQQRDALEAMVEATRMELKQTVERAASDQASTLGAVRVESQAREASEERERLARLQLRDITVDAECLRQELVSSEAEAARQSGDPRALHELSITLLEELEAASKEVLARVQVELESKRRVAIEEQQEQRKCMICMTADKDATIVHGETGHMCCCYRCAKDLQVRGHSCPMCREKIDAVIRQFNS